MIFPQRAGLRALSAVVLLVAGCATATADSAATTETIVSSKGGETLSAFITGYTYWDNTPPGSAAIARPVVHDQAGGAGTWDDPVTVAVGMNSGRWHYAPGTRIYLTGLRKYAVVEDVCGSCGSGHHGNPWLDLYVGGADTGAHTATQCAMKITGVQQIVLDPGPGYPVAAGELADSCQTF